MLPFSNENCKILLYLCYIININSSPFQKPNYKHLFGKESVDIEPKSANTNSQINTKFQVKHSTHSNEFEIPESVPSDLTTQVRETVLYDLDQQYTFSLFSNTQEDDCSQYIIAKQHYLETSNLSEIYEEIDVETINTIDDNIHSKMIVPNVENIQIVNPEPQGLRSKKHFHNGLFRPYMPEEVDVLSSQSQYQHTRKHDYDIPFVDVPSSFSENLETSIPLGYFKTNETRHSIHETMLYPQSLEYNRYLPSDSGFLQHFSSPSQMRKNINLSDMAIDDKNYFPKKMESISDLTTHPINMLDNVYHLNITPQERSHESNHLRKLLNGPPRKTSRHISTVVEYSNSLGSYIPPIMESSHKEIMHTRNQSESCHTFSPTYNAVDHSIDRNFYGINTQRQTFNNADLNLSHSKQVISEIPLQILMKKYERTENDEASIKKISGDFYNFNFILRDTSISCSFEQKNKPRLFLKLSSTPIEVIDANFAEFLFNISIIALHKKRYMYYIPIFHIVDFVSTTNIEYFSISTYIGKYEIIQKLDIYIYQSIPKGRHHLRLKCPRINNFELLINKLLETPFPIYSFPVTQKQRTIRFSTLDHTLIRNEMTINEYIKEVTENPPKFKNIYIKAHNSTTESHMSEIKPHNKDRISWNSGLKIVYDVYEIFHINIMQILEISKDGSKSLDYKKAEINVLLDQIIQKINIELVIYYPRKISEDVKRESKVMSFYVFCVKEIQYLFEWWNEYIFIGKEVPYITQAL